MNAIDKVIDHFGGIRAFARAINKSPSTVQYWIDQGTIPTSAEAYVSAAADELGVGLSKADIESAIRNNPEGSKTDMADEDNWSAAISPIEEIVEDARNGKMYILVDAEDRENEGDLVIPAQFATPDVVNFMATHGRGLICLSITNDRADTLNLEPMTRNNRESMGTAFTVSIEAKEGVTTGISAADRAHTIAVAIDPTKDHEHIVSPGHVFPLISKDGGVLVRAGHTEAAVDISRMAGLYPAGVICEIMKEDGTMARLPDLVAFAQLHNLKIGTISDLIAYRRRNDRYLERTMEAPFNSEFGKGFRSIVFRNTIDGVEHSVLVHGKINKDEPVLTRVHRVDFMHDVMGEAGGRYGLIQQAMRTMSESDEPGVLVFVNTIKKAGLAQRLGAVTPAISDESSTLREYGIGAQILKDLGVRKMILLTTKKPSRTPGLDGYGLTIEGWRQIKTGK